MTIEESLLAHCQLGKFILDHSFEIEDFDEKAIEVVGHYKEVLNALLKDTKYDIYNETIGADDPQSELELAVNWLFNLLDQEQSITLLDPSERTQLKVLDTLSKTVEDHKEEPSFEAYKQTFNAVADIYELPKLKISKEEHIPLVRKAIAKVMSL